MVLDRYDLSTYTVPYWEGTTVYHEAVLPVFQKDGILPDIPLLCRAEKILSVNIIFPDGAEEQLTFGLRSERGVGA